jgi:NAD-dependent dihydropyrimidine dehydrogenase PreA subunit
MYQILTNICAGQGKDGDIELLNELAPAVEDGSMCALGRTAPNPVLTTLRYFKDEYEAHINERRCPAGVCEALIAYSIDPEKCKGCMLCVKSCPQGAIAGEKGQPQNIDQEQCIKCGACREVCKFEAVIVR